MVIMSVAGVNCSQTMKNTKIVANSLGTPSVANVSRKIAFGNLVPHTPPKAPFLGFKTARDSLNDIKSFRELVEGGLDLVREKIQIVFHFKSPFKAVEHLYAEHLKLLKENPSRNIINELIPDESVHVITELTTSGAARHKTFYSPDQGIIRMEHSDGKGLRTTILDFVKKKTHVIVSEPSGKYPLRTAEGPIEGPINKLEIVSKDAETHGLNEISTLTYSDKGSLFLRRNFLTGGSENIVNG